MSALVGGSGITQDSVFPRVEEVKNNPGFRPPAGGIKPGQDPRVELSLVKTRGLITLPSVLPVPRVDNSALCTPDPAGRGSPAQRCYSCSWERKEPCPEVLLLLLLVTVQETVVYPGRSGVQGYTGPG